MNEMKNKWIWSIFVAVSMLAMPSLTSAQITYNSDGLNIGGGDNHEFLNVTVNNLNGIYWKYNKYAFSRLI